MTQYDVWKTTDTAGDLADALHETFAKTDEYMSAYVDHCDAFDSSATYDRAFEAWLTDIDDEDDDDYGGDEGDLDYYGLHPDEPDDDSLDYLYGDDTQ